YQDADREQPAVAGGLDEVADLDGHVAREAGHTHLVGYVTDGHALASLASHRHADARLGVDHRPHDGGGASDLGDDADQAAWHRHRHVAGDAVAAAQADDEARDVGADATADHRRGSYHARRLHAPHLQHLLEALDLQLEEAGPLFGGGQLGLESAERGPEVTAVEQPLDGQPEVGAGAVQ